MQTTVDDFWEMCVENDVGLIIMLCQEFEGGKQKCANYWNGIGVQKNLYNMESNEMYIYQDLIFRNIKIIKKGFYKENSFYCFEQLNFIGWPDHGVPEIDKCYPSFIKMFDAVNKFRQKKKKVLVHCSAGIGRTGVFLAIYNLYKEIMEQISEHKNVIEFNIFNMVRLLKEMRMYLVENVQQYEFIYDFVEKVLKDNNI